MNKVLQRLLVFFIGIPLVISIVAISAFNHVILHCVMLVASILATTELYNIFSKKTHLLPLNFVIFTSLIPSITGFICALFELPFHYLDFSLLISCLIILAFEVFTAKTFENSIDHILTAFFSVFYCGYLFTYISRITISPNSTKLIATFLFIIFMCDSLAWFFGVLFGKNNRGFIKASPNKSLAGFLGGYSGAIIAAIIARIIWPNVFYGTILKSVLLGFILATAGIIGDLVESVIKRCAGCKDSGRIMPGRGGLLDSVDSIIFASPVFYMIVTLFYGKA